MKKDRLPLLKYACVICVVMFIGSNLLLHKDLFEAQRQALFGKHQFYGNGENPRVTQLRNDVIFKVEVPLGFVEQDLKLHRRLLGSAYQTNGSYKNPNRSFINLEIPELSRVLIETSQCENIKVNQTKSNFIDSGWTKAVYRGQVKGQWVAVKTVDEGILYGFYPQRLCGYCFHLWPVSG